jgi:anti-sigma-K factor RskA
MNAYSHDQLLEMATGYALGALSAEETSAFEAALPGNPTLQSEVQSIRETMGTMLRSEPPMAPRASLKVEWLQRVKTGGTAANARKEVRSITARRSARRTAWGLAAAMAASFVGAVVLGAKLERTREQLSATTALMEKRERQLNTVLEADAELQLAMLDGEDEHGAGAQFFWNARQQRGMVHAFHLPPAPAGRVYQVWVHRGNTPISVRVFDSGADGHALVEHLALPRSLDGITSVAITVEPIGGSLRPTTAPILSGEIQRRFRASTGPVEGGF